MEVSDWMIEISKKRTLFEYPDVWTIKGVVNILMMSFRISKRLLCAVRARSFATYELPTAEGSMGNIVDLCVVETHPVKYAKYHYICL